MLIHSAGTWWALCSRHWAGHSGHRDKRCSFWRLLFHQLHILRAYHMLSVLRRIEKSLNSFSLENGGRKITYWHEKYLNVYRASVNEYGETWNRNSGSVWNGYAHWVLWKTMSFSVLLSVGGATNLSGPQRSQTGPGVTELSGLSEAASWRHSVPFKYYFLDVQWCEQCQKHCFLVPNLSHAP